MEALGLEPENSYILVGLGDLYRQTSKFGKAISFYSRLLEFDESNVFALRGIGAPDMIYAATTGKAWFEMCPTVRYDLHGALRPGVVTKDVFLHLAGHYGDHTGTNIEFGESGFRIHGADKLTKPHSARMPANGTIKHQYASSPTSS